MSLRTKQGKYACSYCGKTFLHSQEADQCRDSHDLVYLVLSKTDLSRLMSFLHLKQDELLTKSLVNSIERAFRGARRLKNETSKINQDTLIKERPKV